MLRELESVFAINHTPFSVDLAWTSALFRENSVKASILTLTVRIAGISWITTDVYPGSVIWIFSAVLDTDVRLPALVQPWSTTEGDSDAFSHSS